MVSDEYDNRAHGLVMCAHRGGDDVVRDGESSIGGAEIPIRCLSYRHRFVRQPAVVCPGCGSDRVISSAGDRWAHDDIDEAPEGPRHASRPYVDGRAHHCQVVAQLHDRRVHPFRGRRVRDDGANLSGSRSSETPALQDFS